MAGKMVSQGGEQQQCHSSGEDEVEVTLDKGGSNPELGKNNSGSGNGNSRSSNGNPGEEK
jgi:hypothetical protein